MKPTRVWALFALCLVAALAAMAWSTVIVLRLERTERAARAQAILEENARLALWRMDSRLTLFLAQESARPYFHYSAFYPASGAYTSMYMPRQGGEPLLPSPLLRETPPEVVLHFQMAPGRLLSSPQIPRGLERTLAVRLHYTKASKLAESERRLGQISSVLEDPSFHEQVVLEARAAPPPAAVVPPPEAPAEAMPSQKLKNVREYEMRQESYSRLNKSVSQDAAPAVSRHLSYAKPVEILEGAMTPLWIGEALLLARRVRVGEASYVQGCRVDWESLRSELLASIADLLPEARLMPAGRIVPAPDHAPRRSVPSAEPDPERRLASLPVRLLPGTLAKPPEPISPVRLSLAGAWIFLLLAAAAVALLLKGVMALSERRHVFVSAVTHELRTPLTTFRLYTDMLADGMVGSEERKREYLGRLQQEAQRLGHLVENVLFYARLESGRAGAARDIVDIGAFLEEVAGRLTERTRRAGLTLTVTRSASARARVDPSALEQILVNLVDNACKYAASSTPATIEIELTRQDGRAQVSVRDHGPGLSAVERRRLFRPFSKSDREAASSAPGVGLGLALSQRLARAQGGDLRLVENDRGATFVVSLPAVD